MGLLERVIVLITNPAVLYLAAITISLAAEAYEDGGASESLSITIGVPLSVGILYSIFVVLPSVLGVGVGLSESYIQRINQFYEINIIQIYQWSSEHHLLTILFTLQPLIIMFVVAKGVGAMILE